MFQDIIGNQAMNEAPVGSKTITLRFWAPMIKVISSVVFMGSSDKSN